MTNFAADMAVKQAHGLSLTQWNRLSEAERRDLRDTVTSAPNFQDADTRNALFRKDNKRWSLDGY